MWGVFDDNVHDSDNIYVRGGFFSKIPTDNIADRGGRKQQEPNLPPGTMRTQQHRNC